MSIRTVIYGAPDGGGAYSPLDPARFLGGSGTSSSRTTALPGGIFGSTSSLLAPAPLSPTPALTNTWAGVDQTTAGGWTPADSNIAAGTSAVITVVNDHIDVYSKDGTHLSGQGLDAFFGTADSLFDPRAVWDPYIGRFIVTADDQTGSASTVFVAVSNTSNPADGWTTYSIDTLQGNSWLDYPELGFDATGVYITGNYFDLTTGNYTSSGVWAIGSSALASGSSITPQFYDVTTLGAPFEDAYAPAKMYGGAPNVNGEFFAEFNLNTGTDYLNIAYVVGGASGSPTVDMSQISLGNISDAYPTGGRQKGSAALLDSGDTRVLNAVWRDNKLYVVTEIRISDAGGSRDVVHWMVLDTTDPANVTLINQGNIDPGSAYDTFYGNMTVDTAGNMIIGYSQSGSGSYGSSAYAVISAGGTALQDGGSYLTAGLGVYTDAFGNRWGDYSGMAIDPTDYKSFWVFNQYATGSNSWATTVGTWQSGTQTAATNDFNFDGTSDVLWRNTDGTLAVWTLNNGRITSSVGLGNVGGSWSVAGTGDFNGDGTRDVLWRDPTSGAVSIWEMQNGQHVGSLGGWNVPSDWSVAATGDFNNDGISDILWQNANGSLSLWELDSNGQIAATVGLGSLTSDWSVAGVGDFNGDGTSDILWRNSTNGAVSVWEMQNGQHIGSLGGWNVGSDWSVAGVGDFNGDGVSDILWRSSSSGSLSLWEINSNGQIASTSSLGSLSSDWTVGSIGDFNGDGTSDIIWRNASNGAVSLWQINSGQYVASTGGWSVGGTWSIA